MTAAATVESRKDEAFVTLDYIKRHKERTGFTDLNLVWGNEDRGRTVQTAAPPRTWRDDFLGQDVARFFYKWGGSLAQVLTRIRARYDGDLDQFLIHLTFMLTELAGVSAANEAKAKGAATVIVRRRGLNVLSLSDITAIPRESVRRKLAALAERGQVAREEDGLYYLGPASDIDHFFYDLAPLFWDKARPAA